MKQAYAFQLEEASFIQRLGVFVGCFSASILAWGYTLNAIVFALLLLELLSTLQKHPSSFIDKFLHVRIDHGTFQPLLFRAILISLLVAILMSSGCLLWVICTAGVFLGLCYNYQNW